MRNIWRQVHRRRRLMLLQVVVADSGSLRLPTGQTMSHVSSGLFGLDMPRSIPLPRWDSDDAQAMRLGSKAPARFAAFMPGISMRTCIIR